jgi:RNA polymerase sigma-70 factor (ECF subfamily)
MKSLDSQLINQTLLGDREAFSQLVLKYQGAVYGLAYHKVKNFADAQDIAQEAFMEAYRCLENLQDRSKFASWLYSITANRCKMWLRRRRQYVVSLELSIATKDDLKVLQVPDHHPTPDEVYEQKALRESVMKAIEDLPEKQRLVVTLFYIDDLSYKEIADFLDVPVSTVQSRLQVARQKLKGEMLKMAQDVFMENKLDEEFAKNLLIEAWALYEQEEQCERAIASLQKVIREYPDTEEAMEAQFLIARPYAYLRQVDKEIDALNTALRRYPDSMFEDFREQLADAYMRKGDFESAIAEYRTIMEKFPHRHESGGELLKIGRCYELLGKIEDARNAYRQITEYASSTEGIVDTARRSLVRLEGYEDLPPAKVEKLRRLRREASDFFDRQLDYERAIPAFQKLIEEDAGALYGAQVYICMGLCYEFLGQVGEAIKAYEHGIEKHLKDSLCWQKSLRAMELECDGHYADALAEYDAIISESSQDEGNAWFVEKAHYGRGRCLEKLGKMNEAKSAYGNLLIDKNIAQKEDWMWAHWIFATERALKCANMQMRKR